MSMASLERAIVEEARSVLVNPKFRLKDLMEWKTGSADAGSIEAHDGEGLAYLPELQVWIAFPRDCDKRPTEGPKEG